MADADFHVEQTWPNSCVAACMCMVRARQGESFDEAQFHDGAGPAGQPIELAAALLQSRTEVWNSEELETLKVRLATGHWAIVTLFGPRYMSRLANPPPSKHGALCTPGDFPAPLHAVVAVSANRRGIALLDPFFAKAAQPVVLSNEGFLFAWTGQVVFAQVP